MRTRLRHGHTVTALLLRARSTVLIRRRTGRYAELSDAAVNVVSNGLTAVAIDPTAVPAALREEATALAHRILDDDHPERSPLWPPPGEDLPVTSWVHPRPLDYWSPSVQPVGSARRSASLGPHDPFS